MNGMDFQIEIIQNGIAGFSGVQVGGGRIFLRTEKSVDLAWDIRSLYCAMWEVYMSLWMVRPVRL